MSFSIEKVSEYDQEIPQSHIADRPMAYMLICLGKEYRML